MWGFTTLKGTKPTKPLKHAFIYVLISKPVMQISNLTVTIISVAT